MKNILFTILIIVLTGCVTPIPTTKSMNDFVMMSIKNNPNKQVNFRFSSVPSDGQIKVYQENKTSYGNTYNHTIPSTVKNMLGDYMSYRFSPSSPNKVDLSITLKDIQITYRPLDSGGKQVAVTLFGGELSYTYTTKLVFDVGLMVDGKDLSRTFVVSSEDTQIQGVGTGTSTSNFYRGKDSVQSLIGRSVDQTNNKFLMLLNNYLQENDL
jgi:hypothetical protein